MTDFNDIMEGGEQPIEEPQSTEQVTLKGEEIPEGFAPDISNNDIIAPDEPSKTDEPLSEVPEGTDEPVKELNPYEQRFVELGLDKQFKGGLDEALERIPNMNKYITDLEAERNMLRNQATPQAEPTTPEPPSSEEFFDNPVAAINRLMDEKLNAVNNKFVEMEVNSFVKSKSDYAQMEPLMETKLMENPDLKSLGVRAIPILYEMAKAQQLSTAQPVTSVPAPSRVDKSSAETSAGKKTPTIDKSNPLYWINKTPEERERELGVIPLYRD